MPKPQNQFIHHSPKDKNPHGCLPLYTILSLMAVSALLLSAHVVMPEPVQDAGQGNIYYRNSPFSYSTSRVQSPLPLSLPSFADPAQTNEFVSSPSTKREVQLNGPPPQNPFHGKRTSAILNEADLLALPPQIEESAQSLQSKLKGVKP